MWELNPNGTLVKSYSGLCATVESSEGFCWCLVWILDGAKPEEVLSVHRDDLANINVGLGMSLKAHSRTNTWHNVLFSMQTAAKGFLL
ncbi:hypothetical protein glysoja_048216 [Glycine soja]|uniref:Fe-S metabolism associated domain-containing protein n=1 Tax=Glycine soja TaxID=3848 RepID=A0A0B2SI28_GLYSO|nr:hypothetical protein glysoja_048216 [Glycine soja]